MGGEKSVGLERYEEKRRGLILSTPKRSANNKQDHHQFHSTTADATLLRPTTWSARDQCNA